MLCRLCVIASFDGSSWVLPHAHAWALLPHYTVCCVPYFILVCHALRILPHGWVPPSLYTIYAMHCGYHHMLGYRHCFILYIMLCTADTTTSLDIAIALYYMICTTDTATCVGTYIALYYMLCTAGTLTCVGTTIVLYCMLYAMRVLSTCVCTATALYIYAPMVYNVCCILSTAEHLQALPLVHIIIVCLCSYFIPADRATTCTILPSLYYMPQVLPN